MAPASYSYSAPQRAHLASVWPLGTGAGTQVCSPQLSGLHRPGFLANQDSAFWLQSEDFSEQWSSGLRELLIERTGVLPTGALPRESVWSG